VRSGSRAGVTSEVHGILGLQCLDCSVTRLFVALLSLQEPLACFGSLSPAADRISLADGANSLIGIDIALITRMLESTGQVACSVEFVQ
jgi:hypothetical protein